MGETFSRTEDALRGVRQRTVEEIPVREGRTSAQRATPEDQTEPRGKARAYAGGETLGKD